jgi:hypothetical protein
MLQATSTTVSPDNSTNVQSLHKKMHSDYWRPPESRQLRGGYQPRATPWVWRPHSFRPEGAEPIGHKIHACRLSNPAELLGLVLWRLPAAPSGRLFNPVKNPGRCPGLCLGAFSAESGVGHRLHAVERQLVRQPFCSAEFMTQ